MRTALIGGALIACTMAFTAPAGACPIKSPMDKVTLTMPSDLQEAVPSVAPGEQFAVRCDCVQDAAHADIRVVLALAPDEVQTGYRKLLATVQHIDHNALHVLMPDAPGLANHTVQVQVYVLGANGARSYNAGRVHIV